MATIDLRPLAGDQFVLHFGGRPNEVNAYTFANAILAMSEAIREIHSQLNPGFAIEIAIDAVGSGSFRARLKTTGETLASIFKTPARDLLIAVLAAIIYEKAFAPKMQIIVKDDSYVIERGADRIILSREVYEARAKLKSTDEIDKQISRAFEVLEDDPSISDFGITPEIHDAEPLATIPREQFARLAEHVAILQSENPTHRIIEQRTQLIVLKAVLERSDRKWQFVWNGIRISAPIKDPTFYDRLARREFEFGQGDILDVVLAIQQGRDDESGVYMNERYEVTKVFRRIPGPKQTSLLP